ncbi:MAG: L-lactate permease, partial [Vicinamibacterales bacterium]
ALTSLAAVVLHLRVWRPKADYAAGTRANPAGAATGQAIDSPARVVRAYGTYSILVVVVLAGQVGNFGAFRDLAPPANLTALLRCGQPGNRLCPEPFVGPPVGTSAQSFRFPVWDFHWPGTYVEEDGAPRPVIRRSPPTVATPTPYGLTYRLDFLASAGTLVLFAAAAAFIPMMASGVPAVRFLVIFWRTLVHLRLPIVTIAFILSIATVMNYSGMTSSMALALARTGPVFPFFSAFLGMLGVFLTGSDTSSNTLFGPLQATTARVSGLDPILMAATNSSGGVMGKMISPQNLSIGAAGVGAVGSEGVIFRKVLGHSLLLTALIGLLAMLQTYVIPWIVPVL